MSNVTNMTSVFSGAIVFHQDLISWNISNVTTTNSMFKNASSYDQHLFGWNLTKVTNFNNMFTGATLILSSYPTLSTANGVNTYFAPAYKPLTRTHLNQAIS